MPYHQSEPFNPHNQACVTFTHQQLASNLQQHMAYLTPVSPATQLRCAGVIEAIRISRAAYPNRLGHREFLQVPPQTSFRTHFNRPFIAKLTLFVPVPLACSASACCRRMPASIPPPRPVPVTPPPRPRRSCCRCSCLPPTRCPTTWARPRCAAPSPIHSSTHRLRAARPLHNAV